MSGKDLGDLLKATQLKNGGKERSSLTFHCVNLPQRQTGLLDGPT